MAEIFQLKHSGEQIDALLDKAETAVQPIPDGDGNTYLMADGLVTSEDTHYYFPNKAPANDPAHTFAMASEVQATDAKLTELSKETAGQLFEPGNVTHTGEVANDAVSRTYYIPCNTGDKFSGWIYRIKMFDKNFAYLAEIVPSSDYGYSEGIEITNASCQYVRIIALSQYVGKGTIKRNGVDIQYLVSKEVFPLKKMLDDNIKSNESNFVTIKGTTDNITRRLNDTCFVPGTIGDMGQELENTLVKRSPLIPCSKGDVISSYIYRVFMYDENKTFLKQDLQTSTGNDFINYTITEAGCKYIRITVYNSNANEILVNGEALQYCSAVSYAENILSKVFVKGKWEGFSYVESDSLMSTIMIPFTVGDVIKGKLRSYAYFNKDKAFLLGGNLEAIETLTTNLEDVKYAIVSVPVGSFGVTINGIDINTYVLNFAITEGYKLHSYPYKDVVLSELSEINGRGASRVKNTINGAILGVWIKKPVAGVKYYLTAFRYRQVDDEWGGTEYSQITITEKHEDGTLNYLHILNERTTQSVNDELQIFESVDALVYVDWGKIEKGTGFAFEVRDFLELDAITFKKNNTIYLATLNNGGGASGGTSSNLDNSSYIAMPIPQLAMVNIVSGSLPTSKTADILGTLEFNGMNGNAFTKKIIINAQGNSSLGLAKKNFSIDIMDENYEDSHEIKFGDWVAQDGFHLKSYMLDGIRVKPMAVYDFYESMLLTRGVRKDRAWKRLQLPTDIPMTSNEIADSYLQIDSGAKNHPSGFPVIVYHNGVFYGIYCWQLKKHRDNYHQEKKDAAHIHLDGNISNTLLWNANGVLDWGKWSGKTAEADDIANYDGIEIRNPKTLILTDGTEYDGDTNRGELISKTSTSYDSSNKDMKRTADVRESLENLSRRVYALTQMAKGAEKKSAIAEVFDVESIIDYIIFGQIVANYDGYKKNWQWVTYDGIKWAVNAYDLDGTWGWSSWSYVNPLSSWLHNDTPPVTLIIENYLDEIKARYKELRDKGVIDLAKIMQPLVNYVKVIGIDYYDMEYEKWTDGARDNLWRFESWMEESIKRTDALMGYTL